MRKKKPEKRVPKPDLRYNDILVSKFINALMTGGNKSLVTKLLYKAFDIIEEKLNKPGYQIFNKAIENTSPVVELKSKRVHGATYQVPIQARKERKNFLAIKWIIDSAKKKKGISIDIALANTLIQASKGEGDAVKKKEDTHKMAQANKSFSHFKF